MGTSITIRLLLLPTSNHSSRLAVMQISQFHSYSASNFSTSSIWKDTGFVQYNQEYHSTFQLHLHITFLKYTQSVVTPTNSKYFPSLQQIALAILLVTAAAKYWSVHRQHQPPTNHTLSSVRLSPRTWLTSCVSVTGGNEICTNLVKWTFSYLSTTTIHTNSLEIH